MDLIYCDENFNDIGVLQGYSLDMAYGIDENDFVLKMELDAPKLKENCYIYYEGTEYGGIIDAIEVNTESQYIVYSGRTWYGILSSYVVSPLSGADYYVISGEAHSEVDRLLRMCGVRQITRADSSIFICEGLSDDGSGTDTPITIPATYIRYNNLYESLFDALGDANARLKIDIKYNNDFNKNMVYLSAVPMVSYSAYDEFESELINFKIKKQKNKVNHLICLGSGELKSRHVIHLFTDENSNLQPYLYSPDKTPVEDKDYILSRNQQKLKYSKEVAQIYDYPNAQTAEHYVLLTSKPKEWNNIYSDYYVKSDNSDNPDGYNQIEKQYKTQYALLDSEPSTFQSMSGVYTRQWDSELQDYTYSEYEGSTQEAYIEIENKPWGWDDRLYSNYYTNVDGEYKQIESVKYYAERVSHSKPVDWDTNYSQYYTTDGINYNQVQGANYEHFEYHERQPSDWRTNWYSYYTIVMRDNYVNEWYLKYFKGEITEDELEQALNVHTTERTQVVTKMIDDVDFFLEYRAGRVPPWEQLTYGNMISSTSPPRFDETVPYYYIETKAPSFYDFWKEGEVERQGEGVYLKTEVRSRVWQENTYYYKLDDTEIIPEWKPGIYYRKTYDHYFDLIENAKKRLKELQNTDTLDVKLKENDNMYYIGDSILAREKVTGLVISTKIVKKIVTVDNGIFNIRYEVS